MPGFGDLRKFEAQQNEPVTQWTPKKDEEEEVGSGGVTTQVAADTSGPWGSVLELIPFGAGAYSGREHGGDAGRLQTIPLGAGARGGNEHGDVTKISQPLPESEYPVEFISPQQGNAFVMPRQGFADLLRAKESWMPPVPSWENTIAGNEYRQQGTDTGLAGMMNYGAPTSVVSPPVLGLAPTSMNIPQVVRPRFPQVTIPQPVIQEPVMSPKSDREGGVTNPYTPGTGMSADTYIGQGARGQQMAESTGTWGDAMNMHPPEPKKKVVLQTPLKKVFGSSGRGGGSGGERWDQILKSMNWKILNV
jgi:hypothetical protein